MGFEQLAQLKEQLAAQAKAEAAKKKANSGQNRTDKKTAVDPVVITIGRLQKLFPKAFPKNPAPKVPLKIGIHQELLARSQEIKMTEAELREAIKTWCRGSRYWACILEGSCRVDLDGNAAGSVTASEASQARALESRRKNSRPHKSPPFTQSEPISTENSAA